MKYMKKFMALLAVLTLALTMAVPAFAETTTPTKYTIIIDCRSGICGILCEFWNFIYIEILCSLHILPLCK